MTSKKIVMFGAVVGMTVGSLVPMMFGDNSFFDGWSILGTLIGGFVGIYLGYQAAKRIG